MLTGGSTSSVSGEKQQQDPGKDKEILAGFRHGTAGPWPGVPVTAHESTVRFSGGGVERLNVRTDLHRPEQGITRTGLGCSDENGIRKVPATEQHEIELQVDRVTDLIGIRIAGAVQTDTEVEVGTAGPGRIRRRTEAGPFLARVVALLGLKRFVGLPRFRHNTALHHAESLDRKRKSLHAHRSD